MQGHETILIFYKMQPTYNPQMIKRTEKEMKRLGKMECMNKRVLKTERNIKLIQTKKKSYLYKNPNTIIENVGQQQRKTKHPTQKPLKLMEYLIKTYTNEGDLVLDNCIGSGTTAIACINLKRNFIGIEKEEKYVNISRQRIKEIIETIVNSMLAKLRIANMQRCTKLLAKGE